MKYIRLVTFHYDVSPVHHVYRSHCEPFYSSIAKTIEPTCCRVVGWFPRRPHCFPSYSHAFLLLNVHISRCHPPCSGGPPPTAATLRCGIVQRGEGPVRKYSSLINRRVSRYSKVNITKESLSVITNMLTIYISHKAISS